MKPTTRIIHRSMSLWKRLPIYHVNPVYMTASRRQFSVRAHLYTSTASQVPADKTVNRLIKGHSIATTKDSTLVKNAAKQMMDVRFMMKSTRKYAEYT